MRSTQQFALGATKGPLVSYGEPKREKRPMAKRFRRRQCVFLRISYCTIRNNVYFNAVKSRDVLAALKADGWEEVAHKGSHIQLKHPTKPGRATVPHPERNLPIGTLKSIERQARIKLR
jgi:predicted RNA binding protein YcfA (HicA-like mRNA interferase family)